jgi:hypothetical protein
VKYAAGAPAALGMGFDRWFLFATKAGVPGWIVATLLAIMMLGLALSGWKLLRESRRAD